MINFAYISGVVRTNYPMQKVGLSPATLLFDKRKMISMNTQEEIWKEIPQFDGYYLVSNMGRFMRSGKALVDTLGRSQTHKKRLLTLSKYTTGYVRVSLSFNKKTKWCSAHRLIAITFIPNPENKREVNHKNGDKTDNRVVNLEWVTPSENSIHSLKLGITARGENSHFAKLTIVQVREIRELLKTDIVNKRIAERYNVNPSTICQIKNNKSWKYSK